MPALPNQGKLSVPIAWEIETQKTEMQGAGWYSSVTLGFRPWTEVATLTWVGITKQQANDMLIAFKAGNFNSVWDYDCSVRGPVRLQLAGGASFTEEYGDMKVTLSVNVRRV